MNGLAFFPRLKQVLLGSSFALISSLSNAQSLCVFDVLGMQGPFYGTMREYATAARKWNVELELKAYTSEEKIAEDFSAGRCDIATMTGIRAREFNLFSSSIEAIGGKIICSAWSRVCRCTTRFRNGLPPMKRRFCVG